MVLPNALVWLSSLSFILMFIVFVWAFVGAIIVNIMRS